MSQNLWSFPDTFLKYSPRAVPGRGGGGANWGDRPRPCTLGCPGGEGSGAAVAPCPAAHYPSPLPMLLPPMAVAASLGPRPVGFEWRQGPAWADSPQAPHAALNSPYAKKQLAEIAT